MRQIHSIISAKNKAQETEKYTYIQINKPLSDLKNLQDFSCQNFRDTCDRFEEMRPVSKQPCRSYATRKTRKFNLLNEITI